MNKQIDFTLLGQNLDSLSYDELALIGYNPIGVAPRALARKIFPDQRCGTVRIVKDLHAYAANKATAMKLRLEGRISSAQLYESICERIYAGLPTFAKW